jgi:2-oxoglutarate ferredoxin oxidoreductase subunit alpha
MKNEVVVLFAGDSGDGIQLMGNAFAQEAAHSGHAVRTFSDFPAEIRAPQGSVTGVSGFKLQFGGNSVYTPGDQADVLVVMNAAGYKKYQHAVKPDGVVVANSSGFDGRNAALAGYAYGDDVLERIREKHRVVAVDVKKQVSATLVESALSTKEKDRTKNIFVLGLLAWMYQFPKEHFQAFLQRQFAKSEPLYEANWAVFESGWSLGETLEVSANAPVAKASPAPGVYRTLVGNQAIALGLLAAAEKAQLPFFFGGYPITPASDILHELVRHKRVDRVVFQAEDEISAAVAALGASFGGSLAVTASSGPGISLKSEAMGLAVALELPLVVVNIQRGGPSTGLPTKTEQSDLLQAIFGRHGEAPLPVLAARSATDAFDTAFLAAQIAIECMTPVVLLSDGFIANSAESWRFPKAANLPRIFPTRPEGLPADGNPFAPYQRDSNGVRPWATPGQTGFAHRIGGLEKETGTGNISYAPEDHAAQVAARLHKVHQARRYYAPSACECGATEGDVLLVGWGGTFGSLKAATESLQSEGHKVAHLHLRHVYPLPTDLAPLLKAFKRVIVAELNGGQLIHLLRSETLVDALPLQKVQGLPFALDEIRQAVLESFAELR